MAPDSLSSSGSKAKFMLEGNINCTKIGSGSFGDIYLVIDITNGEEVASLCCRRANSIRFFKVWLACPT